MLCIVCYRVQLWLKRPSTLQNQRAISPPCRMPSEFVLKDPEGMKRFSSGNGTQQNGWNSTSCVFPCWNTYHKSTLGHAAARNQGKVRSLTCRNSCSWLDRIARRTWKLRRDEETSFWSQSQETWCNTSFKKFEPIPRVLLIKSLAKFSKDMLKPMLKKLWESFTAGCMYICINVFPQGFGL